MMDNHNEDDVQNVDNEAADAVTDCLRNSVVLRTILEHFSSPELRQLSFVNKLWKNEAQSVMRKRGHLTAYVMSHDPYHPREEVQAFISDLKQMNPVPFSGISIDIYFEPVFDTSPVEDPDQLEGVVIDQPALKTVSVKFRGSWLNNLASPGFLLSKKVLQDCSGILEELELNIVNKPGDFIEKVVQDFTFPRLKILKLTTDVYRSGEGAYENYMQAMLSRAPNLKMLHSNRPINLMSRILKANSVLLVYTCTVCAPFEEISEDLVSAIKLEDMELRYTGLEFNFERFNRITPMLLQHSRTTLRSLRLDAVFAIPLMSFGISFKNFKHLQVDIDYSFLERGDLRILGILKGFDFTRIFPNLKKVVIADSNGVTPLSLSHMNEIVQQANAVLREPFLDRAANIKVLYLHQRNLPAAAAQFLAEMFPSIENLEILTRAMANEPTLFESIWKNWLDLKELKLQANMLPDDGNLDSVFCGIFPAEVAELRLKSNEYLKKVNIVPVMPALTSLKNLRVLSLTHKDPNYLPFGYDSAFLFSKVTALLAFARLPTLAVSLKVACRSPSFIPPAMTHLEPYVSVSSYVLYDRELHD